MEKLKALFNKRDEVFADKTYEIFEAIDSTLSCVTVFLTEIDELVAQGVIAWEDTSLIDDLVIVIGTLQFNIGDQLSVEETNIEITLDNIADFERVVHMSIPYDLVIGNDRDNIIDYLYTASEETLIMSLPVGQQPVPEFDLSELSDEQLKSFMENPETNRDN